MNRQKIARGVAIGATSAVFATGAASCGNSGKPKPSAGSAQAANNSLAGQEYSEFNQAVPYPFSNAAPADPLERKNLSKRLVTYNSANDTNYVYIFTFSGQAIGYYVISGKVSSTSSAMTSTQVNVGCGSKSPQDQCTNDAIGDDGSYGPEEGGQFGVFFYTSTGTLVETDQPFLVSSSPVPVYASVPQLDAPANK